jgi:hypothetical protein
MSTRAHFLTIALVSDTDDAVFCGITTFAKSSWVQYLTKATMSPWYFCRQTVGFVVEVEEDAEASMCKDDMPGFGENLNVIV